MRWREGPNVPLSFDGVPRDRARPVPGSSTVWAARPVDTTPGIFDDRSHHSYDVVGACTAGASRITLARQSVGLDVYYLGSRP